MEGPSKTGSIVLLSIVPESSSVVKKPGIGDKGCPKNDEVIPVSHEVCTRSQYAYSLAVGRAEYSPSGPFHGKSCPFVPNELLSITDCSDISSPIDSCHDRIPGSSKLTVDAGCRARAGVG